MEDSVHHDLPDLDLVEDCIWKSPDQCPARAGVNERKAARVTLNQSKARVDGSKKVDRALGRLPVIPEVSRVNIKLGLWRETKPPHLRRRSLARTCAQDFAAAGLRAWARRRRSSSLRCASVTGIASGVSTRLSQISSRSRKRSATLSDWMSRRTVLMPAFSAARSRTASRPSVRITQSLLNYVTR